MAKYVFLFTLLFLNILSLQIVFAQTNSTVVLENEVSETDSQERPKVSVSIEGTPNDDKIRGGDGDDEIEGGNGDDTIYGQDGDDKLEGNAGEDILYGEEGDDELDGGKDNDEIVGGQGSDELKGGSGADLFVCDEDDEVADFNSIEEDKVDGNCEIIDQSLPPALEENPNDEFTNSFGEEEEEFFSSLGPVL